MTSTTSTRPHLAPTLGCLLVLALLSGCGLFGGGDVNTSTCGDRDWCEDVPGKGKTDGAYPSSISVLYCHVTQVRQRLADGELDSGDLPDWAETEERNGTPIVVDISTIPNPDIDRRTDDVVRHFNSIDKPLDRNEISDCVDDLTQRDIEATDGKRQAG